MKTIKKDRWVRVPLTIINQHKILLAELLQRRRNNESDVWPYLCDNVIKWKQEK